MVILGGGGVVANPENLAKYGLDDFDGAAAAAAVKKGLGDYHADVLGANISGAVGLPVTLRSNDPSSSISRR